jgi:uncharacterized membrane protein
MKTTRLEAFSDGVIAIIITIMVLELKTPHGTELRDLLPMVPVFLSYVLSFIYVGIYWNNHHHLLHATETIDGNILWANLHLLFWLSLIPFATGWLGENHLESVPTVLYGVVLLMSGFAYYVLSRLIIRRNGQQSLLAQAMRKDSKTIISIVLYAAAIAVAFVEPHISLGLYALVALQWFIPDRRIEKKL